MESNNTTLTIMLHNNNNVDIIFIYKYHICNFVFPKNNILVYLIHGLQIVLARADTIHIYCVKPCTWELWPAFWMTSMVATAATA